jgi:hypothetical protein
MWLLTLGTYYNLVMVVLLILVAVGTANGSSFISLGLIQASACIFVQSLCL